MSGSEVRSTLKPPPKKALQAFHVGQVGADSVGDDLAKGWSLAICCKARARLVEWTRRNWRGASGIGPSCGSPPSPSA